MITFQYSQIQWLAASGVLVDIVGAMLLSRALMWARPKDIAKQPGTYWSGNPYVLRSLCEQTIDARWGGALLVVGFALQAAGNMGVQSSPTVAGGIIGASVAAVLIYLFTRTAQVRRIYFSACDQSGENGAVLKRLFNGAPVTAPADSAAVGD